MILNNSSICGYILSNYPETIEQAQKLFNLEQLLKNESDILEKEIYPSIVYEFKIKIPNCK